MPRPQTASTRAPYRAKNALWPWPALLLLAIGLYFFGLGGFYAPTNGDEMVYIHIARLTAESGHWLPLVSDLGQMRNTKPPLLFWQALVAGDWGAHWSLFALRLPSVVYTLLTAAATAWFTQRLSGNWRTACLAAVIYLAFFSSFDYLQQAHDAFVRAHPGIATWQQSRRMSETDRDGFLARFESGGQGIGFAVLGGSFGEGVDLPGERLIGAFVATLGLPQFNPVNEQLRERMEQLFGCGYDYTYLYPGLQKVVQAAGRVIRTETDQGTVWLIDQRFGRPEVQALLPAWWQLDQPGLLSA
jgi:hypothetical protein